MSDEWGFENPPFLNAVSWSRRSGLVIPGDGNGPPKGSRFRPVVYWRVETRSKRASELPVEERGLEGANSHQFPSRL
jgi:hypothetical protein